MRACVCTLLGTVECRDCIVLAFALRLDAQELEASMRHVQTHDVQNERVAGART